MKQSSTNHPIIKNVTISLMLIGTIFFSNISHAAVEMRTTSTSVIPIRPMEKEKESAYLVRLNEINAMDKSSLAMQTKRHYVKKFEQ